MGFRPCAVVDETRIYISAHRTASHYEVFRTDGHSGHPGPPPGRKKCFFSFLRTAAEEEIDGDQSSPNLSREKGGPGIGLFGLRDKTVAPRWGPAPRRDSEGRQCKPLGKWAN